MLGAFKYVIARFYCIERITNIQRSVIAGSTLCDFDKYKYVPHTFLTFLPVFAISKLALMDGWMDRWTDGETDQWRDPQMDYIPEKYLLPNVSYNL